MTVLAILAAGLLFVALLALLEPSGRHGHGAALIGGVGRVLALARQALDGRAAVVAHAEQQRWEREAAEAARPLVTHFELSERER
ncbi:MAG: hypothetical protein FWD42_01735 [Solirubrobacterales bacterium]|nr:hypothetical protein [Solirubrobacterales bacterium]